MKNLSIFLSAVALTVATSCTDPTVTTSPDGSLSTTVGNVEGKLTVAMSYDDNPIMNNTPLRLTIDGECIAWDILSSKSGRKSETIDLPVGEYGIKIVDFVESEYRIKGSTSSGKSLDGALLVRSYDKAMAYRFIVNHDGEYTLLEDSPYLFADNDGGYITPDGEREPLGPEKLSAVGERSLYTPALYESGNGYVLALHESDIHDYPQLRLTEDKSNNAIKVNNLEVVVNGEVTLPWRTVMYGENITDLHNSKPIFLTFDKAAEEDFSWLKPGLTLWDFRADGATIGGFEYAIDNRSYRRFIDFAAERGIEYFMTDIGWVDPNDPLNWKAEVDLPDIIEYANSKGVGIILHYDLNYMKRGIPKIDFEVVASTFEAWGVKGLKYGFFGSEGQYRYTPQEKTRIAEEIIKTAAEHKLFVNFHDGPVPFSGLERTYPNFVTKEYCHAQLDSAKAFLPGSFVKTICANMLSGAIDQMNGGFSLSTMDRTNRKAGPRNPYYSTVASEAARVFISHTGHVTALVDAADAYAEKGDLFQFIADLPGRWDETRYLEMEFDSHVMMARRSGDDWFAGVVYNEAGGESRMQLDFLAPSRKYQATIYRDAADTHYQTNGESYEIESREVTSKDSIDIDVVPGGGYAVSFKAI